MQASASRAEQVLSFWHQVEFFESTPLTDVKDGEGAIHYSLRALIDQPDSLPWLNRQHVRRAGSRYRPETAYAFTLYLGLFERSELFTAARDAFPDYLEASTEQYRDEGLTCSLTLRVTPDGRVDTDSLAVSTAPWVLGLLQQRRLNDVSMQGFNEAVAALQARLKTIFTVADNLKQQQGLAPLLTSFEVIEVVKALDILSAFTPQRPGGPAVAIALHEATAATPVVSSEWRDDYRHLTTLATSLPAVSASDARARTDAQSKPVTILNSFFIEDIEKVQQYLREHPLAETSPLGRYLNGERSVEPDLLLPEGRTLMLDMLDIAKMPQGRWPSEDAHSMSLMQQFAINAINAQLRDGGLYSVNGPPGTGKTTLLRDLVAHNIVQRAAKLAALSSSQAAFSGQLSITLNEQCKTIQTLNPALAGFEMVVASSNNAAVENVTRELPQSAALGEAYRGLAYLRPVAEKLATPHQKRGHRIQLGPVDQSCWGLIAASLGNRRNRTLLGERLFFTPIGECNPDSTTEHLRTLVPALKELAEGRRPEQDFRRLQQEFIQAQQAVTQIQQELIQLQRIEQRTVTLRTIEREHAAMLRTEARWEARQARVAAQKAPLWAWRAFWRRRFQLKRIARQLARIKTKQRAEALRLLRHQDALEEERLAVVPLRERYPEALMPTAGLDLDAPAVQCTAFGHCPKLNRARSQLTCKAFELHQAWLVAAYADHRNQYWQTLSALMPMLKGDVVNAAAAKALWQQLFMIIPVVSSTFASFARQFAHLQAGDLGWLFIDEAGQATPQQAVGALWRAKRAVVVGDPLQIEPVFTVPPSLVEALAQHGLSGDASHYSPNMASVQTLADAANPYGTRQIASAQWIGSPLRVHRRCREPMFSIANRIAYNDKMIHGLPRAARSPQHSRWENIAGPVAGRHFVLRQAEFIIQQLREHYRQHCTLPAVYIISPFKAVAQGVRESIRAHLPAECFGGEKARSRWLEQRVGTVHTFQGQEEESVILVLGLDHDAVGAADWASRTPNLLNVALTRAKHQVCIIGDAALWADKPYFSVAWNMLSRH